MSYYTPLIDKWATLAGSTDERLAAINSEMVDGPKQAVEVSAVTGYLAAHLKLASLMAYADAPSANAVSQAIASATNLVALFRLPQPPVFRTDIPEIYEIVDASLEALAADPLTGITQTDADALIALANTTINWWAANGYPEPINYVNLSQAGLI